MITAPDSSIDLSIAAEHEPTPSLKIQAETPSVQETKTMPQELDDQHPAEPPETPHRWAFPRIDSTTSTTASSVAGQPSNRPIGGADYEALSRSERSQVGGIVSSPSAQSSPLHSIVQTYFFLKW